MLGDEYKKYNFTTNMNILMSETADDVDKRQGGLFYDIYTAVAQFLTLVFSYFATITLNMHPSTAQGAYLDLHAEDVGLERLKATHAIKRVNVYNFDGDLVDVPVGTMVTPKGNGNLLYTLIEKESLGIYKAYCADTGRVGNEYVGECDLISNVQNIGSVMMSDIVVSARDDELDEELRLRVKEAAKVKSFGGNIAEYRAWVGVELPTIRQMQVYPRDYNDPILNSTILSVVDNDNLPLTPEQLALISEQIDPSSYPGEGRGLAPIGHHPILMSPEEIEINISMVVAPDVGYTPISLRDRIIDAITDLINKKRDAWGVINYNSTILYSMTIFHSEITSVVQVLDGVIAINDLIINGVDTTIGRVDLVETKALQQIPKVGQIDIS